MGTARYIVALVVLVTVPPGLLLWYLIHPFAAFWRRLGPIWTYTILGMPMVVLMVWVYRIRETFLRVEFGTNYVLVFLAALSVTAGSLIAVARKKLLTFGVLAGMPELSRARYPGRLLTEGIYAKIRHPRYVETFLFVLGYALFANYLASYVVALATAPALYLIVLLEERELRQRFGEEYDRYCVRVPRFVPRGPSVESAKSSTGSPGG